MPELNKSRDLTAFVNHWVQAKSGRLCGHVVPTTGQRTRSDPAAWWPSLISASWQVISRENVTEIKVKQKRELLHEKSAATFTTAQSRCVTLPHQNTRFEKRTCAICWCSNAHLRTRALHFARTPAVYCHIRVKSDWNRILITRNIVL